MRKGLLYLLAFGLGAASAAIGFLAYSGSSPLPVAAIIFPDKSALDGGTIGNDAFVAETGTLTGKGVPHPNNSVQVACYRDWMRCVVFRIDQTGSKISSVGWPMIFTISDWQPDRITAEDKNEDISGYPAACVKSTLNVLRGKSNSEVSAEFVEQPQNTTDPACRNTLTEAHKWSLENPGARKSS